MMRGEGEKRGGGGPSPIPPFFSFFSVQHILWRFPPALHHVPKRRKEKGGSKKTFLLLRICRRHNYVRIRSKAGPNNTTKVSRPPEERNISLNVAQSSSEAKKIGCFFSPLSFSGKKGRLRKLRIRHFGKRGGRETARGRKRARERKRERLFLLSFAFFFGGGGEEGSEEEGAEVHRLLLLFLRDKCIKS